MDNSNFNNEHTAEFNEHKFLASCFGRNDLGESNAEISCSLLTYTGNINDMNDDFNYNEHATYYTKEAEFYLENHGEFVQIDLIFKSNFAPELRLFWSQLENFGKLMDKCVVGDNGIAENLPLVIFNVVPDEYAASHYLAFHNPSLWFLQPVKPEDENCKIIRMFIKPENLEINTVPDDIDLTQLEAESSRIYDAILTEK